MEDIYSAIVGEPVSDRERLMMLAQKLRKQQQIGQLGQITGDRVLAPMGAGMVKQAGEQAEGLGKRGEQARYRKYQETASSKMDERERAEQAWREQNAIAERAHRERLEAMGNAAMIKAAGIRADASSDKTKKYKQMTVKQVEDLTTQYVDAENMSEIRKSFDDKYSGYKLPGARGLSNAMAANAPFFATQSQEEAQKWWATFNQIYTLPDRNELFGATLTDNEQAEWKRNAINENMTAKQIKDRLDWYERKRKEKIPLMGRNLKAANYDPDLIDTIFSNPAKATGEEVIELEE